MIFLGHKPDALWTRWVIAFPFCLCFSLDKLKCLEEGEDPEVIPEDTDLVTLGYGRLYFYYVVLI